MKPQNRAMLLRILDGDETFYRELCEQGLVPDDEGALEPEHLELARVSQTLVRELEVNWAGVEIVLRLRRELIDTRRQVASLIALLENK